MTANSKTATHPNPLEQRVPRHVAIIMDGNGRWAESRGQDISDGHHAGYENIRRVVADLTKRGVDCLTLFAFSTENWDRPESEVNGILELAIAVIAHEARELHESGVRIKHLGRADRLTPELGEELKQAVEMTAENKGLTLSIAFDYGGRAEIANAARRMVEDGVAAEDVDENTFNEYLYTSGMPDVDLLIRTGGDFRISNFLLWQTAYAEFYSSETWWPDFHGEHIDRAFEAFNDRNRRFGRRV